MSGVIVKRTPTIVVGGVQQYFKSYALRVLDANGDEASTVSVPSDNPALLGAGRGISGKVCRRVLRLTTTEKATSRRH